MIYVNVDRARGLAHDLRRIARAKEFKPLDDLIAKQIPGTDLQEIEAERQAVREKYTAMQSEIDAAQTPEQLKAALSGIV